MYLPRLVEEVVPAQVKMGELQKVLQSLLREGVPIRDLETIVETVGDWIGHTGNGLGYQALAMYHPESQTAVAIVLNATGPDSDLPAHMLEQLEELILNG